MSKQYEHSVSEQDSNSRPPKEISSRMAFSLHGYTQLCVLEISIVTLLLLLLSLLLVLL
jgi:hypothetical protein